MTDRLFQALIRIGRTAGAYAVALILQQLADLIGLLNLSPELVLIVTPILASLLNGLGKWLRGPDVPATDAELRGATRKHAAAHRSGAFFLPF
jgi:hypothetical protein